MKAGQNNKYDITKTSLLFIIRYENKLKILFFSIKFLDPESEDYGCEFESPRSVVSAPIPVNASHPGVDNSWCLIDEIVAPEKRPAQQPRRLEKYAPVVKANYVNFSFAFLPCHKVLPYEQAVVSVFQVQPT